MPKSQWQTFRGMFQQIGNKTTRKVWARRWSNRDWVIGGGDHREIQQQFKKHAAAAAKAARLEGDPVTAWLEALTAAPGYRPSSPDTPMEEAPSSRTMAELARDAERVSPDKFDRTRDDVFISNLSADEIAKLEPAGGSLVARFSLELDEHGIADDEITDVIAASVFVCDQLLVGITPPQQPERKSTAESRRTCPNFAAWARAYLKRHDRDETGHALGKLFGIDHKTAQKILNAEPVSAETRNKIASNLNVQISTIPRD